MSKPVILVVDEHEDSRIIISTIATYSGFEVVEAADGRRGVELAHELRPTLVILDLDMRRVSGFNALRMIRLDTALRDIPAIAISANLLEREARAAGFQTFVQKPIAMDTLLSELRRLAVPLEA